MAIERPRKRPNRRLRDQMDLVREAIPELGTDPENWFDTNGTEPLRYIYRTGHILVRDEYLARVTGLVPGRVASGLIRGVTLVELDGQTTLQALESIERELGKGVATPDHFVGICPPSRCPATEPDVVSSTDPVPALSTSRVCTGRGIRVAVIDTGLLDGAASTHAWLKGVSGDSEGPEVRSTIDPYVGHGTFIAGVIRAVAPLAEVEVMRVPGTRAGEWSESDMVLKLDQALASGAHIISLSAGTNTRGDQAMLALDEWSQKSLANRPDVVLVAAAGNNGSSTPFWPAAFPWALSVGATNLAGTKRAAFSNYGPWVQVYAPGEDFVNAYAIGRFTCREDPNKGTIRRFKNGLAKWSGTSFATPLVAGMIAARASGRGIDVQTAKSELVQLASTNVVRHLGPVLMPEMACAERSCGCGCMSEHRGPK